jgi:hypothetical protein
VLRGACDKAGGLRAWGRANDCSAAYVSEVLAGSRNPGPKILKALKLSRHETRQVLYRKAS